MGASAVLLGAAIFNPIATEGPGMMESPLVAIVKTATTTTSSKPSATAAAAVSTPKKTPVVKAPKALQEQGYDFDDSAAAKKEVRIANPICTIFVGSRFFRSHST